MRDSLEVSSALPHAQFQQVRSQQELKRKSHATSTPSRSVLPSDNQPSAQLTQLIINPFTVTAFSVLLIMSYSFPACLTLLEILQIYWNNFSLPEILEI